MILDKLGTRHMNWNQVRDIVMPSDERGSLLSLIRFGFEPSLQEIDIDFKKSMFDTP
jgi:hypothetical protein